MEAPRLTPLVPLTLDRPRTLRLDMRAIFQAERALCVLWGRQTNILNLFSDLGTLTLNDLAVLLHQALRHEDPTLTLEQTQDLMRFDQLPAIMTALFDAWNAATQPATPPEEGTVQDGPLASPGVSSGATGGSSSG